MLLLLLHGFGWLPHGAAPGRGGDHSCRNRDGHVFGILLLLLLLVHEELLLIWSLLHV